MRAVRFTHAARQAFSLPPSGDFFSQATRAFGQIILTVCGPVPAIVQHEK